MEFNGIIGNVAAFLTTLSFLPQAIKTIRSKNTRQLSLPMYVMFVSGVALWIYYGIRSEQLPIILGNAITFVLAGTILAYKLRNRSKEKRFL
ncbi:MAG TPA: SemiSWEET transporter [Flavobacteriaceae bacterium]|nr:SemiSWEET transporter [Alteromonas sp.]HPF10133.1 SemiSWEET transporter [Flavobacteriaceae bacterium]HQU22579.1 SemiSWEET transporter [Flavobacteriaceae bacterium]HQU65770.1 SemiSWEET transporter [Flavobacteriaceae bacterium]HRW43801.1 SemiSWEET transporter [Flavobacteriaceae bacterium]